MPSTALPKAQANTIPAAVRSLMFLLAVVMDWDALLFVRTRLEQ